MDRKSTAYRHAVIAYARVLLQHGKLSQADCDAILRELAVGDEKVDICRLEAALAPKG
jgi:hypothetical protein